MQNCQKFMIDFGFYHICQIFAKLFAKNMKVRSEKSEATFMGQIFAKYFFKIYCQKIFAAIYLKICSTGPLTFYILQ